MMEISFLVSFCFLSFFVVVGYQRAGLEWHVGYPSRPKGALKRHAPVRRAHHGALGGHERPLGAPGLHHHEVLLSHEIVRVLLG